MTLLLFNKSDWDRNKELLEYESFLSPTVLYLSFISFNKRDLAGVTVHEPHGLFDVATFPFSKLISKIIILCNSNLSKNTILYLKDNYYGEYFLNLKQVDFSFKNSAWFLVFYWECLW